MCTQEDATTRNFWRGTLLFLVVDVPYAPLAVPLPASDVSPNWSMPGA